MKPSEERESNEEFSEITDGSFLEIEFRIN